MRKGAGPGPPPRNEARLCPLGMSAVQYMFPLYSVCAYVLSQAFRALSPVMSIAARCTCLNSFALLLADFPVRCNARLCLLKISAMWFVFPIDSVLCAEVFSLGPAGAFRNDFPGRG